MKIEYYGLTDKGKTRQNNEDAFIIDEKINFFAIADGMGGHKKGEVASELAITLTHSYFKKYLSENKFTNLVNNNYSQETNFLIAAITQANLEIFTKAQEEEFRGMGTTLSCAFINNLKMSIVHIGDSRIYLIRKNEIKQLTEDDSFVMEQYKSGKITFEEMKNSPFKNILTKAIGTKKENSYFIKEEKLQNDDIILLATDGLTKIISDDEIKQIIKINPNIKESAKELIKAANLKGGDDNITVILIKIEQKNFIKKMMDIFR
ncbi:MAG: Stp1/IreP family PP2C-type Ser/Thr phosphatase [Elusimicrobiales bacterium]|nr:Stp1/IreP family PP2C-type Ser/Thr phosphatase [Elusimicrobiales bacterium]